jgi:hypothetical protein
VKQARLSCIPLALLVVTACGSPSTQNLDTGEEEVTPDVTPEVGEVVDDPGYDCVPTGEEICDGLDNDCDHDIDEDFDLENDPLNCGSCGFECVVAHGTGACLSGDCVVESCEEGFHNLNGSAVDGCEYECTVLATEEAEGDGTCTDGLDNDCDGRTDAEDPDCSDCVPEFCDGADNDCDGFIDEDFDLSSDQLNCGTCGTVCPPRPNSTPVCVLGTCSIRCNPGFVNEDLDDRNGCEAVCIPDTTLDEFTCDGTDSDCDGDVDEDYIPYTCGTGVCLTDSVCWAGVEDCVPLAPLASDDVVCDGQDEDCDGSNDEDFVPSDLCTGYCRTTATCVDGTEVCGDPLSTVDSTCDAVDDDCDGTDDDDYIPYTCGTGGCTRTSTCIAGSEDCVEGGPAPEICNGSDDDCDDMIDNADPSTMCTPPPHATPDCVGGVCVVGSCASGWYDVDGTYSNGCECAPEGTESSSTSCSSPHDLGTFADTGSSASFSGNIVPGTDVDWYKFRAVDTTDTGSPLCDSFNVRVRFTSNPGNVFRMDIYPGSCTTPAVKPGFPCNNLIDEMVWRTNTRSGSGSTAVGECPCGTGSNPGPGLNSCTSDTTDFFIKVYKASGTPVTCDSYTIAVSNG